ncbi:hypothetical protein LBMAG42_56680 [Deltaproteobacteria bacterium]|nr:hypothetical protein LBMAG42_56680 [Deltaproteobacteria bacterium]
MEGPAFPRLTLQSARSEEMLARLRNLLKDREYVERIKRHYAMFRADIDSGAPEADEVGNREQRRAAKRRRK